MTLSTTLTRTPSPFFSSFLLCSKSLFSVPRKLPALLDAGHSLSAAYQARLKQSSSVTAPSSNHLSALECVYSCYLVTVSHLICQSSIVAGSRKSAQVLTTRQIITEFAGSSSGYHSNSQSVVSSRSHSVCTVASEVDIDNGCNNSHNFSINCNNNGNSYNSNNDHDNDNHINYSNDSNSSNNSNSNSNSNSSSGKQESGGSSSTLNINMEFHVKSGLENYQIETRNSRLRSTFHEYQTSKTDTDTKSSDEMFEEDLEEKSDDSVELYGELVDDSVNLVSVSVERYERDVRTCEVRKEEEKCRDNNDSIDGKGRNGEEEEEEGGRGRGGGRGGGGNGRGKREERSDGGERGAEVFFTLDSMSRNSNDQKLQNNQSHSGNKNDEKEENSSRLYDDHSRSFLLNNGHSSRNDISIGMDREEEKYEGDRNNDDDHNNNNDDDDDISDNNNCNNNGIDKSNDNNHNYDHNNNYNNGNFQNNDNDNNHNGDKNCNGRKERRRGRRKLPAQGSPLDISKINRHTAPHLGIGTGGGLRSGSCPGSGPGSGLEIRNRMGSISNENELSNLAAAKLGLKVRV